MAAHAASVVLRCADIAPNLEFFRDRDFRVELVKPADNPSEVIVSGHGIRLLLLKSSDQLPHTIVVYSRDCAAFLRGKTELVAPNGTRVEVRPYLDHVVIPPLKPSVQVVSYSGAAPVLGRAGMQYRDLIPDRQGGRFIASHIRIAEEGPVSDYVHYHRIRFQLIYCRRGRVRVVYEDQGEPFDMEEGDCVLQPPEIRHRVLESSGPVEVVEVACPADHETRADHVLTLPNKDVRPDRLFDGQRFLRHVARGAAWKPWRVPDVEVRDTGIGSASGGVVSTEVVRANAAGTVLANGSHDRELQLVFVLAGSVLLSAEGREHTIEENGCFTLPAGVEHNVRTTVDGTELLYITSPSSATI